MASALALSMVLSMKDKASKTAGTAGKALGSLGKLAGGVALGAVAAAGAMGALALKLASDSAKVDATRKTFDKLAISIGSDGPAALAMLGDATRGMVADADLMLAGNKFLAMGLADTAEGAANLAEMATQLGMAMGEDATASMENFALMMANQSIPRLDSFGISSSVVRERILELMAANEDMSREAAFNAAVMEQGALTMAKVGEQSASLAAKTAMAKAQFANFKDTLGQAFMPILNMVMTGLGDLATKYGPAVIAWVQQAGIWMGENLPIAMQKLSDFWTTILQPAIQVVSDFVTANIFPLFETLFEWLQEKTPGALETLRGFWEDTLLPAIRLVWDFLKTSVIPLIQGFIEVQLALLSKALEFLAAIWREKVQPALVAFWDKLGGLEGALDGIKNAIGWVNDKLQKFKDWLDSIHLPDWLTPGSPTPLEMGLRGIADGFSLANKAAGKFEAGIKGIATGTASLKQVEQFIPSFSELFARQFADGGMGSGGGPGGDVGPGGTLGKLTKGLSEMNQADSPVAKLTKGLSEMSDDNGVLAKLTKGLSEMSGTGGIGDVIGGKGYGEKTKSGGGIGDVPSWTDHAIMPPADTSGRGGTLTVTFLYDGKSLGEVTARTGMAAATSIDMTPVFDSKGG